jgi:hypothetical protein
MQLPVLGSYARFFAAGSSLYVTPNRAEPQTVMVLTPVERIPGRSGGLADQVQSALCPPADNGPFTATKLGIGAIANSHPTFTDTLGGHAHGTRPSTWSSTRASE